MNGSIVLAIVLVLLLVLFLKCLMVSAEKQFHHDNYSSDIALHRGFPMSPKVLKQNENALFNALLQGGNKAFSNEEIQQAISPIDRYQNKFMIKRKNGTKLLLDLQVYYQYNDEPIVDLKKLEKLQRNTTILLASPAYFYPDAAFWTYVPLDLIGNMAWNVVKTDFEFHPSIHVYGTREEEYTPDEIKNELKKALQIPSNFNIKRTNHYAELGWSLLMHPYLSIAFDMKPRDVFNQSTSSVNLYRDWFNNPKQTDKFYQKLIDDWSYYSTDEYRRKVEKLLNLDCLTVFNLASAEIYSHELQEKTKDFFSHIRFRDYAPCGKYIFNDVVAINEIEKEITSGKSNICLYLAADRNTNANQIVYFLMKYYGSDMCSLNFDEKIDEMVSEMEKNPIDLSSKYGKFVVDLIGKFRYDKEVEDKDYYPWHLRTIDEMEKEKLWICHDSAYYVWMKLQTDPEIEEVHRYSICTPGKRNSHGFCIFKHRGKYFIMDACHSHASGVFGPFKSTQEALTSINNRMRRGKAGVICVDEIKPGSPFEDFLIPSK